MKFIKNRFGKKFIDIHEPTFITKIQTMKQDGLSYNEIGHLVNIGIPTIKRLLHQYPIIYEKECLTCHSLFLTQDRIKKKCQSCTNKLKCVKEVN